MNDPHLLAGAYALDALDDVERAGFERHLRACTDCVDQVGEFREVGTWLAGRVAMPPPPELKSRVLAQARETRQESPPAAHPRRVPRAVPRRPLLVAAAAVLLAGGVGLGGVAWGNYQAAEDARLTATQITGIMTDPDRTEAAGQITGGGAATVVASGGSAVFAARDLPAPPSGRTYQLWVMRGTDIRSAGLLDVRAGTTQAFVAEVGRGESLAVSIEPDGGSDQPTTTPVVNVPVA